MEPSPSHVEFRFYAELNDHLPRDQRYRTLTKPFFVSGQVKDLIESFGVPHTEVELIVVNGESVPFSYIVCDGDRIAVYPVFEAVDITPELKVRREPLRDSKFVLDVHLGKLAAYLRMLGFDTLYRNCYSDPELVRIASSEKRVLLTRDRALLMHNGVTHGYCLRETDSRRQLAEVVDRFDLARCLCPFTRCMACNTPLADVPKQQISDLIPPRVAASFDDFRQCPHCRKVYWRGSHYRRMQQWISGWSPAGASEP